MRSKRLGVDPGSIRATTYARGLKDHPRHAEAVPMSFAPSVNFEILDMVEGGGDWVAVRWQLTATCDGKSFQESIIAIYRFELCFGVVTVCTHLARTYALGRADSLKCEARL